MTTPAASAVRRSLLPLAAMVAALGAAGCSSDGVDLPSWTLEPPNGAPVALEMPAKVGRLLPEARSHYLLRTEVALTPELRGAPLTLSIPRLVAHATLRANGQEATALDDIDRDGYRAQGAQRWRIPADATRGERLDLALDVEHTWTQSAWLDTVPHLGRRPDGGARFAAIRAFNQVTTYLAVGLAAFSGFLYLVVFLSDRRRTAYGWFALTGFSGALYPLFQSALLRSALGPAEVAMAGLGVSVAAVSNMAFTRAHFGEPAPSRAWAWACAAASTACCASIGYFRSTAIAGSAAVALAVPAILSQIVLLVRLGRRGTEVLNRWTILGGWALLAVVGIPDFVAWLGFGELLGGLRAACFGIFVIGLLQGAALSRVLTLSLREADALAAERQQRIVELELRTRDVELLNDELRRQVAARSGQLAAALARLKISDTDEALSPGDVVEGRYRVVRAIGAGGGGIVYLVERLADGAKLALKVVRAGGDAQALARLAREAELAAGVKHENVISVVDVDITVNGHLFIVMEYVPGSTLRDRRDQYGNRDWALPVLQQLAAGLSAIHRHGIVHRDLKPANVLLVEHEGERSKVRIGDFGVARSMNAARLSARPGPIAETRVTPADARLTQTGVLLGTPLYMAPEAVGAASDVTAAADVFAFGIIAYELLTRRLPFDESPAVALLNGRDAANPATIDSIPADVPRAVAALVVRCLSLAPEARPSADEACAILDAALLSAA